MTDSMIEKDPADQFQIGERVIFVPEGVRATIVGYRIIEAIGDPPKIVGYQLNCGLESAGKWLRRDVEVKDWDTEREEAVAILRMACADHGDNDWPDDLHLADVIQKHLQRHLDAALNEKARS